MLESSLFGLRRHGIAASLALTSLVMSLTRTAAAQEDAALTRFAQNPLLTHGPAGAIDQLKLGPRAMLREAPGVWKMWYEAVPGGNKSLCAYATSKDGVSWTRYAKNPVLSPSAAWEGGANNATGETSPTSVLKEHGVYRLWYHGFSGGSERQIGYATSLDGINWSKYAQNPVLTPGVGGDWDADSVCEPNVVHVGATYYMYYSHCVGAGGIGLATSADGVSWTKYAGNPVIATGAGWENQQVDWAGAYYDGKLFHLWYLGRAASDTGGFSLGHAFSSDGKTFTKSAANPVLAPPKPAIISTDYAVNKGDGIGIENSAKVFRLGGTWRFYYGGFASCCPEDATLSMATSPVLASPNRAPVVDAGRDFSVEVGVVAPLDGTVMDDDAPVALDQVTAKWTKVSGPGTASFENATTVDTGVSFDAPGTYVLELSAKDTQLSGNATVMVTVTTNVGSGAGGASGDSAGGDATAVSAGADSGGAAAVAGGGGTLGSGATSSGGVSTAGAQNRGGTDSGASGGGATSTKSDSGCGCRLGSRRLAGEPLLTLLAALVALRRRRRPIRN
jgi:predicted GH43/DUF377 family glycosyl hydrolase